MSDCSGSYQLCGGLVCFASVGGGRAVIGASGHLCLHMSELGGEC